MNHALADASRPMLDRFDEVERHVQQIHEAIAVLAERQRWVDVQTAAEQLGVHPCTIRRALKRGELVGRRVGRRVLVALPAQA